MVVHDSKQEAAIKNYAHYSVLLVFIGIIFLLQIDKAVADTSDKCQGETGYFFTNDRNSRNPRAGGFVSHSAFVDDSVFIARTAAVCGSASVLKSAKIYGTAIVSGEAEVTDKARIYGNAKVSGTAYVGGEAKVSDHAQVSGNAIIEGVTWVRGYMRIDSGTYTENTLSAEIPKDVLKKKKIELFIQKMELFQDKLNKLATFRWNERSTTLEGQLCEFTYEYRYRSYVAHRDLYQKLEVNHNFYMKDLSKMTWDSTNDGSKIILNMYFARNTVVDRLEVDIYGNTHTNPSNELDIWFDTAYMTDSARKEFVTRAFKFFNYCKSGRLYDNF